MSGLREANPQLSLANLEGQVRNSPYRAMDLAGVEDVVSVVRKLWPEARGASPAP
jgi:hypothetical protein